MGQNKDLKQASYDSSYAQARIAHAGSRLSHLSVVVTDACVLVQDLDVEGDGMQGPPSPLQFDTALALEDQTIRAIAEAPMDILTADDPEQAELDAIMADQVHP